MKRKTLGNKKVVKNDEDRKKVTEQISSIDDKIGKLRKEVKLCEDIKIRSTKDR